MTMPLQALKKANIMVVFYIIPAAFGIKVQVHITEGKTETSRASEPRVAMA